MLDDLAALGPFFAVSSHPPEAAPRAPWRLVSELTSSDGLLGMRIASVREALAAAWGGRTVDEIEPRVAASAVHLGLAARLTAPALGGAVLRRPVGLRPGALWWQDTPGGPVPLSVPDPAAGRERPARVTGGAQGRAAPRPGRAAPGTGGAAPEPGGTRGYGAAREPGGAAPGPGAARGPGDAGPVADAGPRDPAPGEWDRVLLDELIAPLTVAVARLVPVSGRVLWGNVASAVNAAAAQVAGQRPDLAADAWRAASLLFASPWLRGERNPPGPAFRRSSCCLFYRLAPGNAAAVCGDCVLRDRRAPRQ
jgi:hypothetical protein